MSCPTLPLARRQTSAQDYAKVNKIFTLVYIIVEFFTIPKLFEPYN